MLSCVIIKKKEIGNYIPREESNVQMEAKIGVKWT